MWMRKKLLGTACALMAMTSVGMSSAVQAQSPAKTYNVAFSQSEISTTIGAERVFARIQDAAYAVCKDEFGGARFVTKRREMKKCVAEVVQDFVSKANHTNLNSIASGKVERFKQYAAK